MGDTPHTQESLLRPRKSTVVDLSHPLISAAVPAAEGHPKYSACCVSSIATGNISNVHSLTLGTHTGTHIDAPYHFFDSGTTVDKLDLSLLTAVHAVVADLRHKKSREPITWEDLEGYEERMSSGVALLLCTGWSKNWCAANYDQHPFLTLDAAKNILARGIKVVGVDTMSPDEITEDGDVGHVHRQLLGNGGVIVENLTGLEHLLQSGIADADLRVTLLPLCLSGCDGSPIRAVAWSK